MAGTKNIKKKTALLIPTFNAGGIWPQVLENVASQSFSVTDKIIVDSGSTDDTVALAVQAGFTVIGIKNREFNHGATRQLLIDTSSAEIGIFMTQDAILASPDSLKNLLTAFENEQVGLAYGRQLPHKDATANEAHARLFNYPDISSVRSYADKEKIGFKACFCSNSFAAYRTAALNTIGGFRSDSIMGEDALAAGKMLIDGYKVAYVAKATVYHSHDYSLTQEFRRYFDTRVFHEQNNWLISEFGKPAGEGLRFLKSELAYVLAHDPARIFKTTASLAAKWTGYKLGKFYKTLPISYVKNFSMHRFYWEKKIN